MYSMMSDVLPYVGEGMPNSPVFGDMDGDGGLEAVTHAVGGQVVVFEADGSELYRADSNSSDFGSGSNANDTLLLPLCNSPSLGDLDGDGTPDIVDGGAGMGYATGQIDDGHRYAFDHFLGAWDGKDGSFFKGFPQVMEDLQFFQEPAIGDIDGDGTMDVLTGSGGFVLHAWNADGDIPRGWPKVAGQWILSSPVLLDWDGDGWLDVVVGTRQGQVFAWRTTSPAGASVSWPTMRHDPRNTGNLSTPLPDFYNTGYTTPDDTAGDGKIGCGCGTTGRAGTLGVLALVVALSGRRRKPAAKQAAARVSSLPGR